MRFASDDPRVLMLGMGWFPSTLGGLDRYYRCLFEQLPQARGVVIGPAEDAPPTITAVAGHELAPARRLLSYWRAAHRAMASAEVVDAHFALYAAAPLLLGRLAQAPARVSLPRALGRGERGHERRLALQVRAAQDARAARAEAGRRVRGALERVSASARRALRDRALGHTRVATRRGPRGVHSGRLRRPLAG